MHYQEIIKQIELIAPPAWAASWDNSGLQLAAQGQEISKMALCLDPSPQTLKKAAEFGAQFVLSHHPLFLKPAPLNQNNLMVEALRILFRNDIWLYSAHTSLDASFNSQVNWLGQELKLTNCQILDKDDPKNDYGFGLVGDLPEPLIYLDFTALLSKTTAVHKVSVCGVKPKLIKRVAYLAGSGSSAINKAIEAGAQVFITGDLKYHPALDLVNTLELMQNNNPNYEFCVLDLGHFSIEEEMMRRWAIDLAKLMPTVEVLFLAAQDPLQQDQL